MTHSGQFSPHYNYRIEETCKECNKKTYRSIDSSNTSKYIEVFQFMKKTIYALTKANQFVLPKNAKKITNNIKN